MHATECDNERKHYVGSAEVLNLKILLLVWDIYMAVTAFVNLL
jgi:hypothetical protein